MLIKRFKKFNEEFNIPENIDNMAWYEEGLWYGWTYNQDENRYYFYDLGYKSISNLWEDQWKLDSDSPTQNL